MKTHLFKPGKRSARFCTQCGLGQEHPIHHTLPPVAGTKPHTLVSDDLDRAVERALTMLDLTASEIVQVQVSTNSDGTETLWVNVDGICRLRAVRPQKIIINDERKRK